VRGYYKSVPDAYKSLPKWFDTFRKRIQRALKKKWEYVAFVEAQTKTRDGMPHFHIICLDRPKIYTTVIDKKTKKPMKGNDRKVIKKVMRYKDLAWECGFGYQCDVQRLQSKKAAAYVAKYASKIDPSIPKGFRRVRASEGWKDLPNSGEQFDLMVKGQNETLTDYLLKVNDVTSVPIDTLLYRWYEKTLEFAN